MKLIAIRLFNFKIYIYREMVRGEQAVVAGIVTGVAKRSDPFAAVVDEVNAVVVGGRIDQIPAVEGYFRSGTESVLFIEEMIRIRPV